MTREEYMDRENEIFNFGIEHFNYASREVYPGFKEILRLEQMLKDADIPYTKFQKFGGYIIAYVENGVSYFDVAEHCGTYGNVEDLLEIYRFPECEGDVIGHMTAERAFELYKREYEKMKK